MFLQVLLTPDYLAIVMEYAPGGDMFEYVVKQNGLDENSARWFFQQLVVAMDYCHKTVRAGRAGDSASLCLLERIFMNAPAFERVRAGVRKQRCRSRLHTQVADRACEPQNKAVEHVVTHS